MEIKKKKPLLQAGSAKVSFAVVEKAAERAEDYLVTAVKPHAHKANTLVAIKGWMAF